MVVSADGREIVDNGDLSRYVASQAPGQDREARASCADGEPKTISVTLGTFPDDPTESRRTSEEESNKLGMTLRDLTPEMAERLDLPRGTRGVVVMDVEAGEAAEHGGPAARRRDRGRERRCPSTASGVVPASSSTRPRPTGWPASACAIRVVIGSWF